MSEVSVTPPLPERALVIRGGRVLTLTSPSGSPVGSAPTTLRRGWRAGELGVLARGDVVVQGGTITAVGATGGEGLEVPPGARVIEARGRVVMPGFVDAHTHACFAGDRLEEWKEKLAGTPYPEILKRGGGIMSTVRAVRGAGTAALAGLLSTRLNRMLRLGSTTIEVKSGYGLSTEGELSMLEAIEQAARGFAGSVQMTALLGHAVDVERCGSGAEGAERFASETIERTLPAVVARFGAVTVDAFVEEGAWSVEQAVRLFNAASERGCRARVHTDQFTSKGMIEKHVMAGGTGEGELRRPLATLDHLEAAPLEALQRLAKTEAAGVLLPVTGLHTDRRYASGRKLIDAGGAAVVATNFNPGTSPSMSMPLAVALAVRFCGLTVEEAIVASTLNAALALGMQDRGVLAAGKRADVIMLAHTDERELAYELGGDSVELVVAGGVVVREPG